MDTISDIRYELRNILGQGPGRQTWVAVDTWTGVPVVVKGGPIEAIRRECSIQLSLPPGIAAPVRDVLRPRPGELWFVQEQLPGQPLGAWAADLAPDRLPWIVRELAQCLAHAHRAGVIHADLSPGNVLVLDGPGDPVVRLLDFGFARSRDLAEEGPPGGTPPHVAPEVLRGWIVDGRADQFSLGSVLRELFPWTLQDGRWSPILEQLCQRSPGRRFPHLVAVRDALERAFDLPRSDSRWPPFGGGPMYGREELMAELLGLLKRPDSARILLVARRGLGLSRFLLEVALGAAAGDGPPLRVFDIAALLAEGCEGSELIARLADRAGSGEMLLCGLPDPSRRLREFPPDWAKGLRAIFSQPGWEERALPALDASAFAEIVTGNLESGGDLTESLASRFLTASDGDLRCSAEWFRAIVQQGGSESGSSWVVDLEQLTRCSQRGSLPTPQVDLTGVTPEELRALRLVARAGRSFPHGLAGDLLARFDDPAILPDLLDAAFLVPRDAGGLCFVTGALWKSVLAGRDDDGGTGEDDGAGKDDDGGTGAIDSWLNERAAPNPHQPDEVLFAARRAHRLGDRPREAEILAGALAEADASFSWGHARLLLAYPDEPPLRWSPDRVRQQIASLAELLAPAWNTERLLVLAAKSLDFTDPGARDELLAAAAESADPAVRASAHAALAERRLRQRNVAACEHHLSALEALAGRAGGTPPGVIDHLRGMVLNLRGEAGLAEEHFARGEALLEGAGREHRTACVQMLAVLRFARDPAAGIALLENELQRSAGAEREAQIRSNLCIMYSQIRNDDAATRCVEDGLRRLRGRISSARLASLRCHRAWSMAESDHVERALLEAMRLARTPTVRMSPLLRNTTRGVLGLCHLHLGHARAAVQETARAWRDLLEVRYAHGVSDSLLQFLDVILDFGAWESLRELGSEILDDPGDSMRLTPAAQARLRASRAQLAGDAGPALEFLVGNLEAGRGLADVLAAARYLHHTGLLHLVAGRGREGGTEATELFTEELRLLGDRGRSYYRGRALQCLARAQARCGNLEAARSTVDASIALARTAGCTQLLVDALETRLQFGMHGSAS